MLKQRIVAFLPIRHGIVVQSIGFSRYLPVGKPRIAVEFLNQWGADEIVLVDITASEEGRCIDSSLVKEVSEVCHVPLAVGGGVKEIKQMRDLLQSGADKIVVNEAAFRDPRLLRNGASEFGVQCMIRAIDVKKVGAARYEIFYRSAKHASGLTPKDLIRDLDVDGVGEIFLNSVDRDGSKHGLDLDLIRLMGDSAIKVPMIVCGGVGHPQHIQEGLSQPRVSGVAIGNALNFTEHSIVQMKSFLRSKGMNSIRLDSYANYEEFEFSDDGKTKVKSDKALEALFFEYHPKEVI